MKKPNAQSVKHLILAASLAAPPRPGPKRPSRKLTPC
jgi:hypothetical protein